MKIMARDYDFMEDGIKIEGTFLYDADVIDEDTVNKTIQAHGCNMDNRVFKKDAPCFFLPKAQADMLRYLWVKQRVDQAIQDAPGYEEPQADFDAIDKC